MYNCKHEEPTSSKNFFVERRSILEVSVSNFFYNNGRVYENRHCVLSLTLLNADSYKKKMTLFQTKG